MWKSFLAMWTPDIFKLPNVNSWHISPLAFAKDTRRVRSPLGLRDGVVALGIPTAWELAKNGRLWPQWILNWKKTELLFSLNQEKWDLNRPKGRKSYQKNNWHSRSKDTQPRIEGRIYQHPPCTNPSWGTHQPGWSPMLTLWPCFIWAEIFSGATKGCLSSRRWIQINISNISSPVTASMISGWTQNRVDIRLKLRVLILLRSQLRPGKPCLAWGTCSFPPGDDWNE